MGEPLIAYSTRDGVALIELNAPPANAYTYEMNRELSEAVLAARLEEDVHALVVTGKGEKFFCAGADISMLAEKPPAFKYQFALHANETFRRLETTPKLVVAAINGHCLGGGLELAMACDLRVAKQGGGKLGLPEVNLGVLPGTGGTQRLPRLIGKARALELMVTGKTISVEEAHELGLVNAVFEADGFMDRVMEYVQGFLPPKKASKAVGAIKRAVQSGLEMSLEDGLALERELLQQLFESEDAAEGLTAYQEKRESKFKGR